MTDDELRKILEDEWTKRRPRIPMGKRRIELAIAAMRRAFAAGRESALGYPATPLEMPRDPAACS